MSDCKSFIEEGKAVLGIEFGSTRIKAVLIDDKNTPIAQGSHEWENRLENHIWTYSLEDIWSGLQDCYRDLTEDVKKRYGAEITKLGAIGFSAMMHGYLAFDNKDELLVPFRTWRNTITGEASEKLTRLFNYPIPQRWSISHLYQAILNKEPHVAQVSFFTTLAGYVHWKMTGQKVIGIGDGSGMFPIDTATKDFDQEMIKKFDTAVAGEGFSWKLSDILPKVLVAGEDAGTLTAEGAKLLDPTGKLQAGAVICPPEGDAGTGMAATNAVARRTGNVSAGTSVFIMAVLEKALSKVYSAIDLVTTPSGDLVAMVHCNNCTSDINAWVNLFDEFAKATGHPVSKNDLYTMLFRKALEGDKDCGGLLSYNYFSGESITGFEEGRPLFVRTPDASFTLANFMRMNLFSALGALKVGMDILFKEEKVELDKLCGHGGYFKTEGVGSKIMAAAANVPVSVMETAGEGGAWGIALLAGYNIWNCDKEDLGKYLDNKVFAGQKATVVAPDPADVAGFDAFMKKYVATLPAEKAAVENLQ